MSGSLANRPEDAPSRVYDGRISVKCQRVCQAGECRHPRTVDGCGGCCGCLGGCVEGYEEQMAEADSVLRGEGQTK